MLIQKIPIFNPLLMNQYDLFTTHENFRLAFYRLRNASKNFERRELPAQRLATDRVPQAEILLAPLRVRAVLLEDRRRGGRVGGWGWRRTGARRQPQDQRGQNSWSHQHASFPATAMSDGFSAEQY